MTIYTLRMAQVKDDLFGQPPKEDLTQEDPQDPGQYMTDPSQYVETEDDLAQDLAQGWVGEMTRIGPELYVEDSTASLLTALKALGLPMGSKQDILTLSGLFIDDEVLMNHIGWFNDEEWMKLVQWLQKLPAKVSFEVTMGMLDIHKKAQQSDPALDLLMSLQDLEFDISANSPKTQTLLALLAKSGGQASGIAQQILSMDSQSKAALFDKVQSAYGGPAQMSPGVIDKDKQLDPGVAAKTPAEMIKQLDQDILEAETEESKQELMEYQQRLRDHYKLNKTLTMTPPPGGPTAPPAPGPAVPVAPEQSASPSIQPVASGESTGVLIYPEDASRKTPWGPAKGGQLVVSYTRRGGKSGKSPQKATVIGKTSDGKLAVRLIPSGTEEVWDSKIDQVRVSR